MQLTSDHPRGADLRQATCIAYLMVQRSTLYSPEEVLGQLLKATRIAFDIAGSGEDESQRRALFDRLADYVDAPASPPHWTVMVRATAERLGRFSIPQLIDESRVDGLSPHRVVSLLQEDGYQARKCRQWCGDRFERIWQRAKAA